jgi:hypothetical protein
VRPQARSGAKRRIESGISSNSSYSWGLPLFLVCHLAQEYE